MCILLRFNTSIASGCRSNSSYSDNNSRTTMETEAYSLIPMTTMVDTVSKARRIVRGRDRHEECWNRKNSNKTRKYVYISTTFGIGIYSPYSSFFRRNQNPKSALESDGGRRGLCMKIDGITFDCSPLTLRSH